jgi:tRNA A58 N-methylase Trm61
MKINKETFETTYGFIDYHYSIEDSYPHGILIFLGSYINKEFRGKGLFRPMLKEFFNKFPKKTEVQLVLSNKKIVNLFKDFGLTETNENIEYWGKPSNTINLKGFIL